MNGDRFVVRDAAARRVVGGGVVVEPTGAIRGRAKPPRLAFLSAMRAHEHRAAMAELTSTQLDGMDLDAFAAARGLTHATTRTIAAEYRDATGLGRNLTIELLEFLDRCQVTRFDGNRRGIVR